MGNCMEDARVYFRKADEMRRRARELRNEAEGLERAAKRFDAIGSATADGRELEANDIILAGQE